MRSENSSVTRNELIALGVGVTIVVLMALLTTRVRPIAFPFNFLLSLVLGAAAAYGSSKVFDPRTKEDHIQHEAAMEFHKKLVEIRAITIRIHEISQSSFLDPETAHQLTRVVSLVGLIARRYKDRAMELTAASYLLTILQNFEPSLMTYFKIKSGEQFVAPSKREAEMIRTQQDILPMLVGALEAWGERMDSGEITTKRISEGTLESMLRSLGLIEGLNRGLESPPLGEGVTDDQK